MKAKFILLLFGANLFAVVVKFWLSQQGATFDLESYKIVSDIVKAGGNVYSETSRYNYGPIWFLILGAIGTLCENPAHFHLVLVAFLAASDAIISVYLSNRISLKAGVLFALNPISAIITGYYVQFDTLAILLGLLALGVFSSSASKKQAINAVISTILLALSLSTKHLLIFLPICLFIRERSLRTLIIAGSSYACFLISFLPFVNSQNINLIINNVFLYQSAHNVGLIKGLLGKVSESYLNLPLLFAVVLLAGTCTVAFLSRSKPLLSFFTIHLASIFCLLPGMAPQYLVYFVPVWIQYVRNIYFGMAVLLSLLLLLAISPGLQVNWIDPKFFRLAMIQLFVLAGLASLALPKPKRNPLE